MVAVSFFFFLFIPTRVQPSRLLRHTFYPGPPPSAVRTRQHLASSPLPFRPGLSQEDIMRTKEITN